MLDSMAQRYGVLPTDLLSQSIVDWSLNFFIYKAGREREARQPKQRSK